MDVRCERCRAQYAFEDSQITAAGLTVQCSACGHVFRVKKKELVVTIPVKPGEQDRPPWPPPPAPEPLVQRPAAPPAEAAPQWTIRKASGQTFSFSELNTLQRWIVERRVARDDEVMQADGTWVRLGTLVELQPFFDVVEAADRSEERTTSRYPAAHPGPPPPPAPPPAAPSPAPRPAPTAGSVQIDLDESDLRAVGKAHHSRNALVIVLLLVVAGAALAYVVMPGLFGNFLQPKPEPPAVAAPPPAPPAAPDPTPPVAEPKPEVKPPEPEPAAAPPAAAPPAEAKARPPATLKQQLAEARRLREGNRWEQALDLYGRITSQEPDNVEALAGRGLCYFDLEQFAPAEASLQAALRLSPAHPEALLGLAETYRALGRKAEAIAQFERYLAAHPEGDEAAVARNAINQLKE